MTNPTIKIHNLETGEIIEREMNVQELAQFEAEQVENQIEKEVIATKAAEKAALLEKLGITAEEAQLLLGGN
jgi:hypothetical protein